MPEKKVFVVVYEEVTRRHYRVEAENAEEAKSRFYSAMNRGCLDDGVVIDGGIVEIEEDI